MCWSQTYYTYFIWMKKYISILSNCNVYWSHPSTPWAFIKYIWVKYLSICVFLRVESPHIWFVSRIISFIPFRVILVSVWSLIKPLPSNLSLSIVVLASKLIIKYYFLLSVSKSTFVSPITRTSPLELKAIFFLVIFSSSFYTTFWIFITAHKKKKFILNWVSNKTINRRKNIINLNSPISIGYNY